MNQAIAVELQFFFISILWGAIILAAYDVLRIIRRIIKHGIFFLAVEDLIFWMAASVFIFSMIYEQNNGIIRGFSVMGMTIGILLYHYIFRDILVDIIVTLIRTLLRPFVLALKAITRGLKFLLSQAKKAAKFLIRQLKKLLNSVKIAVGKRTRVLSEKRKKHLEEREVIKLNRKREAESRKMKSSGKAVPVLQPAEPVLKREHSLVFERVIPADQRSKEIPADLYNSKSTLASGQRNKKAKVTGTKKE
jgi:spore cortex biosynthesis protein YabQ